MRIFNAPVATVVRLACHSHAARRTRGVASPKISSDNLTDGTGRQTRRSLFVASFHPRVAVHPAKICSPFNHVRNACRGVAKAARGGFDVHAHIYDVKNDIVKLLDT